MATFHIHEDQETQITNVRLKPAKNVNLQQKRSALGTINQPSTNISHSLSLKRIGRNAATTKTSKVTAFTIHEDIEQKEKNVTLKAAPKVKLANKENEKPPAPSRQPLKELQIPVLEKEEKEDDAMSEGSTAYEDELTMAVDKSMEIKELKLEPERLYDLEEYREDIFKYLKQTEERNRPKANYMRRQPDVTYSMRTILIDWLVEVGEEYKLHTETLHIAVYLIDRFLSLMSVVRAKLQLLGTAAMFVASKYEEIYPPDVSEFTFITDDTYTKKQVLRMEHLILKVLMFDISVPTMLSFIQIISVSCAQKRRVVHLAMYLSELTLLEGDPYFQFVPSKVACSALALARNCLDYEDPWPAELEKFTGYTVHDLIPCIEYLNFTHSRAPTLPQQAVVDKYKSSKLQCVSEIEHKSLIVVPI